MLKSLCLWLQQYCWLVCDVFGAVFGYFLRITHTYLLQSYYMKYESSNKLSDISPSCESLCIIPYANITTTKHLTCILVKVSRIQLCVTTSFPNQVHTGWSWFGGWEIKGGIVIAMFDKISQTLPNSSIPLWISHCLKIHGPSRPQQNDRANDRCMDSSNSMTAIEQLDYNDL